MRDIPEGDWKRSRELHKTALDRLCASIVQATLAAANDPKRSNHEQFLAIYSIINKGNDEVARIFDGASRSRCMLQLLAMRGAGLLTDEELEVLTPATREWIRGALTR